MLPMPRSDLLTAGQVAALAGVHRSTVHHWAKDGKLPVSCAVNGIRLFELHTVERFIAQRPTAAPV